MFLGYNKFAPAKNKDLYMTDLVTGNHFKLQNASFDTESRLAILDLKNGDKTVQRKFTLNSLGYQTLVDSETTHEILGSAQGNKVQAIVDQFFNTLKSSNNLDALAEGSDRDRHSINIKKNEGSSGATSEGSSGATISQLTTRVSTLEDSRIEEINQQPQTETTSEVNIDDLINPSLWTGCAILPSGSETNHALNPSYYLFKSFHEKTEQVTQVLFPKNEAGLIERNSASSIEAINTYSEIIANYEKKAEYLKVIYEAMENSFPCVNHLQIIDSKTSSEGKIIWELQQEIDQGIECCKEAIRNIEAGREAYLDIAIFNALNLFNLQRNVHLGENKLGGYASYKWYQILCKHNLIPGNDVEDVKSHILNRLSIGSEEERNALAAKNLLTENTEKFDRTIIPIYNAIRAHKREIEFARLNRGKNPQELEMVRIGNRDSRNTVYTGKVFASDGDGEAYYDAVDDRYLPEGSLLRDFKNKQVNRGSELQARRDSVDSIGEGALYYSPNPISQTGNASEDEESAVFRVPQSIQRARPEGSSMRRQVVTDEVGRIRTNSVSSINSAASNVSFYSMNSGSTSSDTSSVRGSVDGPTISGPIAGFESDTQKLQVGSILRYEEASSGPVSSIVEAELEEMTPESSADNLKACQSFILANVYSSLKKSIEDFGTEESRKTFTLNLAEDLKTIQFFKILSNENKDQIKKFLTKTVLYVKNLLILKNANNYNETNINNLRANLGEGFKQHEKNLKKISELIRKS